MHAQAALRDTGRRAHRGGDPRRGAKPNGVPLPPLRALAPVFRALSALRVVGDDRKNWQARPELHRHCSAFEARPTSFCRRAFESGPSTRTRTSISSFAGLCPGSWTMERKRRPVGPSIMRNESWCGRRESHPHELALIGISGRSVYCSATSAKSSAAARGLAPAATDSKSAVRLAGRHRKEWSG